MSDKRILDIQALNEAFRDHVPHNAALGLTLVEASIVPATAVMCLPWDERWVGNPETGVLHGGVITALLDATLGAAVHFKLQAPIPIATLDLRVDYLKPALPKTDVHARAECVKATHNVAFVRGIAYHDDPNDLIATASATFMIATRGESVVARSPASRGSP